MEYPNEKLKKKKESLAQKIVCKKQQMPFGEY